jgi:tetratricopeptide (TPR) repeat protein
MHNNIIVLNNAENGDTHCQYIIGLRFKKGKEGVVQDFTQARKWLNEAARKGHSDAQFELGLMYEKGEGVVQDIYMALKWYNKAIEMDQPFAYLRIGCIYVEDKGVPQDMNKAMQYWLKGAVKGNLGCQFLIAYYHEKGQGVKQNYVIALYWYKKAAEESNNSASQYKTGLMYEKCDNIEGNYDHALAWYAKAAKQGNTDAQKRLHELPQELEEKEVHAQYIFKDGAGGLADNISLLNIAIGIAEKPIIEKIFLDLATRPDYMNLHNWCREPTVDLSYNEIIATFEKINRMHHGLVYVKKIGGIFGAFATPEFRLSPDGMEVARLLRNRKK